jgi:hypothetical protein
MNETVLHITTSYHNIVAAQNLMEIGPLLDYRGSSLMGGGIAEFNIPLCWPDCALGNILNDPTGLSKHCCELYFVAT